MVASLTASIPVSLPKIAYTYDYGYRLESSNIAELQQRHADQCAALGPFTCQIVSMSRSGSIEDDNVRGRLELAVISAKARDFGKTLSSSAQEADGEQIEASISGEDLSKNIIDTEARLRSRMVLRDRLLEVLQTRKGKVSELVEAERSVAQINEEIDQARSWLEEMKGRVAFARVNVDYTSANAPVSDFMDPVRSAMSSVDSILGFILALMIFLASVGLPLAAAIFGARWIWRRRPHEAVEA